MIEPVTAYALGPVPSPAAAAVADGPRFAPVGGDFWHSPALGLLVLAVIFLYLHTRIL